MTGVCVCFCVCVCIYVNVCICFEFRKTMRNVLQRRRDKLLKLGRRKSWSERKERCVCIVLWLCGGDGVVVWW